MCAQCCRLRYELYEENGNRIKTKTDYLLSPKDMFLLEDIGDLIDTGVSSFKIPVASSNDLREFGRKMRETIIRKTDHNFDFNFEEMQKKINRRLYEHNQKPTRLNKRFRND